MIQSLYTGASAMTSQMRNIDSIANNIANISTTGFKKSRVDFKDALYGRMISPVDNSAARNLERGVGVGVMQTMRVFSQGSLDQTGGSLDFAVEGEGFFTLQTPNGDTVYERGGSFHVSVEAEGNYLVNSAGYYALDNNGQRVRLEGSDGDVMVQENGEIAFRNSPARTQLGIVTFSNPAGLEGVGQSMYRVSENSGEAVAADKFRIHQGYIEASNVDLGEEMARMVRAQRAYQFASRCISTADQMAQLANTLR